MGRRLFQHFIGWPVVMHDPGFCAADFSFVCPASFFACTQVDYRIYYAETESPF
ncbi:glyoxalase/dioxygenase superfamily protein [Neisseria shayeganii 871]|uniref:Glyoxalase/dioxygenase superfamily protein n=1 Tax=Neisseria shayeganii 871 TaxID=1032488 RepID=G4CLG0_9NEIS|nr:glyoxalase/dioxygenase superfamily protein [Neisseria shayeganii 871]